MPENVKKNNYDIFTYELEQLKSGPNENDKVVYEECIKEKQVGFFRKKTVVDVQLGNILQKGNYISVYGLCQAIKNYLNNISITHKIILENLYKYYTHYLYNGIKFDFKDNILSIIIPVEEDKEDGIKIDCNSLPKVIYNECRINYNSIKEDIYSYLPYITQYKEILKISSKEYYIGEYTTLKIEESDMLNDNQITLIIQFGEFAIFEIQITGRKKYQINTFSFDSKINNYLNEKKLEMFNNIFIDKDKIIEILDIFDSID